ncbi:hypothetical protein A5780_06245 [Nocardia sp. 852002-20019_SCH5090214]|jgi:hypothetical protein|uniref:Uncharacterized protein n=2 Tax=Nocardia TaxID=1817 RepID=A0A2T2Z4Y2_9NOCA|nr:MULTISPECIES: hypothetical protein [Nocardia]OBF86814.1 hypothetical protein A9X06_11910 [Mycobacterium sp. 852002-51759_SCH5129042]MBF6244977.1 hypothetical protein [Nocardia elegans]MBF6272702.1 hypothetical protein [Nocardia nova]MBF6449878.1 hypothetical protein [Nocardia elegans]MBV7701386.1 hypothetical protein [Nocardia nova]
MRHGHGRGFGRPGGWQQADLPDAADAPDWFAGRLPSEWFSGPATIEIDRDEIVVIGELALPAPESSEDEEAGSEPSPATVDGLIARFRESTRPARMQIAQEAQARYGRNVAWGVSVNGERTLFTHLSVPVMTRLRQPERKVLDTLVDAGVARSRADALAWTVKLAGKHAEEWLAELRSAMRKVDDLRAEGPRGL